MDSQHRGIDGWLRIDKVEREPAGMDESGRRGLSGRWGAVMQHHWGCKLGFDDVRVE